MRIASEVAGALDHAHRLGIIHRDIKPENIMLQDGHVLVADFGIGKAIGDTSSDTLTQVGMSVGTPAYVSPEQAVGEEVDGRSDLYSLGCVLYEMLVGEPPFTGPTIQAVIAKRFVQTPLDVAALREGVPRAVSRAVSQALARVAVDRYDTAALFAAALNEADTVAAKPSAPAKSLAILPFENLSADPDNQYFADGIADDLLDAQVQVDGSHVASRSSAFSYRGKSAPLAEIGETLHVATVVQGSLRRSGNPMRLTVQLISVADGYHLWPERFDREVVDVFAVQDEIAAAIAAKLQLAFVPPAEPAGKATTAQVQAFELVAKGRALATQRGASLFDARHCLEAAIRLDLDNAEAYAMLGDVMVNFIRYGLVPASDGIPLAKAALARALELDPSMAFAMGAQALLSLLCEHEVQTAIDWWEKALAVQPRLSELRANYALHGLMLARQRDDKALEELVRAVRDDPRNALVAGLHSVALAAAGHADAAAAESARACELDPHSFLAWHSRLFVLSTVGDADVAVALSPRVFAQFGRHPLLLMWLPRAYLRCGERRRAEAVYAELKARLETDTVQRIALALAANSLGYVDEAIEWALESVHRCDNTVPAWTSSLAASDAFRAHPRYPELLRAMGV